MAEINWGIINNTPNVFAMGLEGLQAGQQAAAQRQRQALITRQAQRQEEQYRAGLAKEQRRRDIVASYGTNPEQAKLDAAGEGLTDELKAWGDLEQGKRDELARRADGAARLGLTLLEMFPNDDQVEQRKQYALANAGQYEQFGITPDIMQKQDFSTPALKGGVQQAQSVADRIAQTNKDRDYQHTVDKDNKDADRADKRLNWDMEHGRTMEGISRGQLGVAQANLGLSRERLGLEGQRVEIERGKAAQTALGKPLPAPIQTGYVGNTQSIRQIDEAIAAIKAYPQAVGLARSVTEGVNQRLDPRGVEARAKLANIGSLIIHDRAGASQTVNETKRLTPFVPDVSDGARAAIKKLETLRKQYENENSGIEVAYGEGSGYRALPRSAAASSSGPVRVQSVEQARALPPGTRFITPDGREKVR